MSACGACDESHEGFENHSEGQIVVLTANSIEGIVCVFLLRRGCSLEGGKC